MDDVLPCDCLMHKQQWCHVNITFTSEFKNQINQLLLFEEHHQETNVIIAGHPGVWSKVSVAVK